MEENYVRSRIDVLLKSLNKEDYLYVKSILVSKFEKDFMDLLFGVPPINRIINHVDYALEKLYKHRKYPNFHLLHICLTSLRQRKVEPPSTIAATVSNTKTVSTGKVKSPKKSCQIPKDNDLHMEIDDKRENPASDAHPVRVLSNVTVSSPTVGTSVARTLECVVSESNAVATTSATNDSAVEIGPSTSCARAGFESKMAKDLTRQNKSTRTKQDVKPYENDVFLPFSRSNVAAGLICNASTEDVLQYGSTELGIVCSHPRILDCGVCIKLLLDTALTPCLAGDCTRKHHSSGYFVHIPPSILPKIQRMHDKGKYFPLNTLASIKKDPNQGCSLMFSMCYSNICKTEYDKRDELNLMHLERSRLLRSFACNTQQSSVHESGVKRRKH